LSRPCHSGASSVSILARLVARTTLLSPSQRDQLARVRAILDEACAAARELGDADTAGRLQAAVDRLDDPFLLVVVGEFNAGKSALINALLGESVFEEGVTPTTAAIQMVRHAEAPGRPAGPDIRMILGTAEFLRDVHLVDTPGTNAITREHQAVTEQFVPRADLVLFTTSADRPLTESEHRFMERIRKWGKKVIVVINKIDLLADADRDPVIDYVRSNVERLLSFVPEVFAVSARLAREGQAHGDAERRERSGLPALEGFIRTSLDDDERFRLKLLNPVGLGVRFVNAARDAVRDRSLDLEADLETVTSIRTLLERHRQEVDRGLEARLAEVDLELHRLEKRGESFFDEVVRIGRLMDLLNRSKLRADFERQVVGPLPYEIESRVRGAIDWLVGHDRWLWQEIRERLVRRRTEHADHAASALATDFERDRADLLGSVGKTVQTTLDRYDDKAESARVADATQNAVASAALLEVGAVGLGTVVSVIASTTVVDVTGTLAAGVMAALGFFVIPRRRRLAKRDLRDRVALLREQLTGALRVQLTGEIAAEIARVDAALAPYFELVDVERRRLEDHARLLEAIVTRLAALREEIEGSDGAP